MTTTTFGIIPPSSPAFLSEEPDVDEIVIVDLKLIACQPADLSLLPPEIAARLVPLTDFARDICQNCEVEVHVSNAQISEYMKSEDTALILCLRCAGIMLVHPDVDCSMTIIRHVGGS